MKPLFFTIVVLFAGQGLFAESKDPVIATIGAKGVLLYENPKTSSPVVRRIFPGEVIKVTETLQLENGEIWGKVFLSPTQVGYIQGFNLSHSGTPRQEIWSPREVVRAKLPISFAMKGPAELFGAGLQLRYLPFTRLGVTAGAGSIYDHGKSRGSSLAIGMVCILSMDDFSPFVETGTSNLTFNGDHSSLKVSTFYINAGVEWMHRSGYFIGVGVSYVRSYKVQVAYDYGYAKASSGSLATEDYGSFSDLSGSESLERVNPLLYVGYSF